MPGSILSLHCHDCHAVFKELYTGASRCWEHGEDWSYEQVVCVDCKTLQSRPTPYCCREGGEACRECGGDLEPWEGRIWLELAKDIDDVDRELVEGPCPRCGAQLTRSKHGLMGLWD